MVTPQPLPDKRKKEIAKVASSKSNVSIPTKFIEKKMLDTHLARIQVHNPINRIELQRKSVSEVTENKFPNIKEKHNFSPSKYKQKFPKAKVMFY